MKVEVKLFALARQLAGSATVEIEVAAGARVADLRAALGRQYPRLAPLLGQMLFSIGNDYAADDAILPAQGAIACIPPVSGG